MYKLTSVPELKGKSPAFRFYAGDFLADEHVAGMTLEEVGLFIKLLCFNWIEKSIPDPHGPDRVRLARRVGITTAKFAKLWPAISPCFSSAPDHGRLINKRLELERLRQAVHSEKQRKNAYKRYENGENPSDDGPLDDAAMAVPPQSQNDAVALPKSCLSSSLSSSLSYTDEGDTPSGVSAQGLVAMDDVREQSPEIAPVVISAQPATPTPVLASVTALTSRPGCECAEVPILDPDPEVEVDAFLTTFANCRTEKSRDKHRIRYLNPLREMRLEGHDSDAIWEAFASVHADTKHAPIFATGSVWSALRLAAKRARVQARPPDDIDPLPPPYWVIKDQIRADREAREAQMRELGLAVGTAPVVAPALGAAGGADDGEADAGAGSDNAQGRDFSDERRIDSRISARHPKTDASDASEMVFSK